jgi:N-acetylmuramoyl-L-alanine amidase
MRASLLSMFLISCLQINAHDGEVRAYLIPAPAHHTVDRTDAQGNSVAPTVLILHYTSASLERTLEIFTGQSFLPVAPHYTISEEGVVFQHVSEERGGRHAGPGKLSYWRDEYDLNRISIGIEQVNRGYRQQVEDPEGIMVEGSSHEWYSYDERQLKKTILLCHYLIEKYQIEPRNVVGHSDVAPGRKVDPGPLFPWQRLAQLGIGAWPDVNASQELACLADACEQGNLSTWLIEHLHLWGYRLPDETASAQQIIQAFQMHFRPNDISGAADVETAAICAALIRSYLLDHTKTCPCDQTYS